MWKARKLRTPIITIEVLLTYIYRFLYLLLAYKFCFYVLQELYDILLAFDIVSLRALASMKCPCVLACCGVLAR